MSQIITDFLHLNEFIRNVPGELENRNFMDIAPVYPFTTENISGYLPYLNLNNKSVLTISGSGDHVLNAAFSGATVIDAFDLNRLSGVFTELKMKAVQFISFEEYLRYFVLTPNNKDVLSREIYDMFSMQLSENAANVMNELYASFRGQGHILRSSHVFYNQPPVDHNAQYYNVFMKSEENYRLTRKHLANVGYSWFQSNVNMLARGEHLSRKYDVILLSNVADYAHRMYPGPHHLRDFFKGIITPLLQYLTPDGVICAACIFRVDSPPAELAENDLYHSEKRNLILTNLGLNFKALSFPGAIKGYNDGLILIKNMV